MFTIVPLSTFMYAVYFTINMLYHIESEVLVNCYAKEIIIISNIINQYSIVVLKI